MKNIFKPLAFIILMNLLACQPQVTFTEPQPTDTENLAEVPLRLHGEYLSQSDNSTLMVHATSMYRIYDGDYKIHISQIDSNTKLSGDTLINLATQETILIQREGDSLIQHFHYIDTLFQINEYNILRKLKGYYFLNTPREMGSWEVRKMALSNGRLTISSISSGSDLDKLKEISESAQDTVPPYKFTVTKKQFKKFIRKEGFNNNETFIRIKK